MYKCPPQAVLSWACALLQSASSLEPPLRHRPSRVRSDDAAPPMRFRSPSACPRSRQQHRGWVCLTQPLAPSGFRNLSTRFDPPRACRPCFMPDPLMGLHPPELFSHHVAVRRFRRRSPLGVGPRSSPSQRLAPARTREDRNLLEPDDCRRSARAETLPNRAAAAHPAGAEAPSSRPAVRPSSAEAPFEPDSGATLRAPKRPSSRAVTRPSGAEAPLRRAAPASFQSPKAPFESNARSILRSRSSVG